jgi:anti-sigma factor ChrR (cupin superfamily)
VAAEAWNRVLRDPDLVAQLALSLRSQPLPTARRVALRERVLGAMVPATRVVRADQGEWIPVFRGIRIKSLRRDEIEGSETSLWRLEPGARVPRHTHARHEECMVLEGSIIHAGSEYFPGDFLLAEPGARHQPFDAPNGALLLIRSELVPRLGWAARTALYLLRR